MSFIRIIAASSFVSYVTLTGCASTDDSTGNAANAMRVTVAQESDVITDGRLQTVTAGKSFISKGPATISAKGYFPMTVVPVRDGGSSIDIKLEEVPKAPEGPDPQVAANQLLSEVLKAQRHIASGQGAAALTVIETAQVSWPGVTFLDYLKASALVVNKDYDRALAVIEAALSKTPDSPDLKELKAFIKSR